MRLRTLWIGLLLALLPSLAAAQRSNSEKNKRLTADAPCATMDVEGLGTATVDLTGTWSGTVTIYRVSLGGIRDSLDTATANEAIGDLSVASWKSVEVCFTTPTSGTVVVNMLAAGTGGASAGGGTASLVDIEVGGTEPALGAGVEGAAVIRTTEATDSALTDAVTATQSATEQTATAVEALKNSLADADVHGNPAGTAGAMAIGIAQDIDGSAIPNLTTEGNAARLALSLSGAGLFTLVNESATLDLGALLGSGIGVEDAAETAGGGLFMAGAVVRSSAAGSTATAGDNATFNVDPLGRLWMRDGDPCSDPARITHAVISESTNATNEIVALNGSDLIYVCSYKLVTTLANSLNWTRGTGSDCGTGTTAIEGAQPYAANGGVAENGGGRALFVVPAGNALCLVSSVATAHGGRVSYVRTAAP